MGACGGILNRIELPVGDITRESQGDINNNNSKPQTNIANSNILIH